MLLGALKELSQCMLRCFVHVQNNLKLKETKHQREDIEK